MMRTVLRLYTAFLLLGVGHLVVSQQSNGGSCQTIPVQTLPMCRSLPYSSAFIPNRFGHTHIEEARYVIETFIPLVRTDCSTALRPLLCGTYFPKCSPRGGGVEPCAMLCRKARADCEPTLMEFGFPWPGDLDCRTFSEKYRCDDIE